MKVVKPDSEQQYTMGKKVFLAGSIEQGTAIDWQEKINIHFKENEWDEKGTLFNPRRDEWDSSWKQEEASAKFNEQVNWEMNNLETSDIIFLYLDPKTKSPISLLELGLHAKDNKMIVCCPDGFWRKGNVEIVCTRYNIPLFNDLETAIGALETKLRQNKEVYKY